VFLDSVSRLYIYILIIEARFFLGGGGRGRCCPTRAMPSSFMRFLDHAQRHTTIGKLLWKSDQLIANTYLSKYSTHNRLPCPARILTHILLTFYLGHVYGVMIPICAIAISKQQPLAIFTNHVVNSELFCLLIMIATVIMSLSVAGTFNQHHNYSNLI